MISIFVFGNVLSVWYFFPLHFIDLMTYEFYQQIVKYFSKKKPVSVIYIILYSCQIINFMSKFFFNVLSNYKKERLNSNDLQFHRY